MFRHVDAVLIHYQPLGSFADFCSFLWIAFCIFRRQVNVEPILTASMQGYQLHALEIVLFSVAQVRTMRDTFVRSVLSVTARQVKSRRNVSTGLRQLRYEISVAR